MIASALRRVGQLGTGAIAGAVFVGLAFPALASAAKPLLIAGTLLPFIIALTSVEPRTIVTHLRAWPMITLILGWCLIAGSLVSAALIALVGLGGSVVSPFIIVNAACAPIMASAAIAPLLGLSGSKALAITICGSVLTPLTVPPMLVYLAGLDLSISAETMGFRLALLIGGSFAAASVLRSVLGRQRIIAWGGELQGLSVIGLAIFALAIMDGLRDMITAQPLLAATMLACAFAINAGLQTLSALLFLPLVDIRSALTIGLLAGNGNLAIVLASVVGTAPPDFVLYIAMAQFPIYLLPALQRPLYRYWLRDAERRRR